MRNQSAVERDDYTLLPPSVAYDGTSVLVPQKVTPLDVVTDVATHVGHTTLIASSLNPFGDRVGGLVAPKFWRHTSYHHNKPPEKSYLVQGSFPLDTSLAADNEGGVTTVRLDCRASDALSNTAVEPSQRGPVAQAITVVQAWRFFSALPYMPELAVRVEMLLNASVEELGPLSSETVLSLQRMLGFLEGARHLKKPTVVLTPDGHFRAQWRRGPTSHFAAAFLPDGTARFVVFADRAGRAPVSRVSGIVPVSDLLAAVEPLGIRRWAT